MRRVVPALLAALLAPACQGDDEVEWVRFNADDAVTVEVTAGDELGDPVSTELHSTTGAVVVGMGTVDPGSGPVGTEHQVLVEVDDEWEDLVGRVTVRTDAGDRGVEEHLLERDSADHGLWVRPLVSVGEEGEVRTDIFTFLLWVEEGDEAIDTGE